MKPRLKPVPLTDEDRDANFEFAVMRRGCCWIAQLLCDSWDADRRDANLMLWLSQMTERHYYGRDVYMPADCFVPLAHLWVRMDPEWPAGHYLLDLT